MQEEDIRLTPELKARLEGFLGFTPDETTPYTPVIFRDKDDKGEYLCPKDLWPVFYLGGKTGVELMKLDDLAACSVYDKELRQTVQRPKRGEYIIENVRRYLKGWKNYRRRGFKEDIPWDKEKMLGSDGCILESVLRASGFEHPLLAELSDAIDLRSKLTKEELMGLDY